MPGCKLHFDCRVSPYPSSSLFISSVDSDLETLKGCQKKAAKFRIVSLCVQC